VEISSHYPYYPAKLAQEPETQGSNAPLMGPKADNINTTEAVGGEKVDLVRQQNQVSPLPEPVDLDQAAVLLRQVQAEFQGWGKPEAQELYQYDRLRGLLFRVYQPLEA
jgi:hypothetical protein